MCFQTLDGAGATISALQGEHDDDRTAHIHFAILSLEKQMRKPRRCNRFNLPEAGEKFVRTCYRDAA
jgi:hypothetical protein